MILDGLTKEEELELMSKSLVVAYRTQETIFHKGEEARSLYILLEGSVCICDFDENGNKKIITNIEHEGDVFGEVFLYLDAKVFEHDAIATKATRICKIPVNILQNYPAILNNLLMIFAKKAYILNRKVRVLSGSTLREKLLSFLEFNQDQNGIIALTQSREEWAAYMNVTRPSLSRELMKMQEDGVIEIDKNIIRLKV